MLQTKCLLAKFSILLSLSITSAMAKAPDKTTWRDYLQQKYGDGTVVMRSSNLKHSEQYKGYKALGVICLQREARDEKKCLKVQYILLKATQVQKEYQVETEYLYPMVYEQSQFAQLILNYGSDSSVARMRDRQEVYQSGMNITRLMNDHNGWDHLPLTLLMLPVTVVLDMITIPFQVSVFAVEQLILADDLRDGGKILSGFLYQNKSHVGELVRNDKLFSDSTLYIMSM